MSEDDDVLMCSSRKYVEFLPRTESLESLGNFSEQLVTDASKAENETTDEDDQYDEKTQTIINIVIVYMQFQC